MSLTAMGGVEILIPKLTLILLFVVKPATLTIPSAVPSVPVVEFKALLSISPILLQPAGNEGTGV